MEPLDISSLPLEAALDREWLCVNRIGGYASSTSLGMNTRKYHGLLVAAMAPPVRRMVILSRIEEFVRRDGWTCPLCNSEYPGVIHPDGHQYLRVFHSDPFPRWAWQADGWTVEKQLYLPRGQNTVCVSYVLVGSDRDMELEIAPLFALRPIHELMYQWNGRLRAERLEAGKGMHIPATGRTPEAFFICDGKFESRPLWYLNTIYRREQERGYAGLEDLWTPGVIRWTLKPGQPVHFACSTEPIEFDRVLADLRRHDESPAPAAEGVRRALENAGDQFILNIERPGAATPGHATPARLPAWTGVISQYPWGTVRRRSSLIALPGLMLVTKRREEARRLLMQSVDSLRNGLMASQIPEDGSPPLYSGADISLWFVHAAWQYLRYNPNDESFGQSAYAALERIITAYKQGTDLGIRLDADGLINVEAAGEAPTWMDARLGDWIVTPRQGKAVEINALWHNALRVGADWAGKWGHAAAKAEYTLLADEAAKSFNRIFWNEEAACCFDVVRGEQADAAIRPNQLFAVSLPFAILNESRREAVLQTVMEKLLTPAGVRTLSPDDPNYQGRYAGNVVSRDRAHHQGSVFPWLLGPLSDALLAVRGRSAQTRQQIAQWIEQPLRWLQNEGMGQICELFDGDAPHHCGGGPADARAVAEITRCHIEHVLDIQPLFGAPKPPEQSMTTLVVPPIGAFETP